MQTENFIARLKEKCPSFARRVYGAAESAVAKPNSMITPVAFVIPLADSSKGSFSTGGHSQEITEQIGVVIVITNKADIRGENASIDADKLRLEVMSALCGWLPQDADLPVDFIAGKLLEYDNYTLKWSSVFTTGYFFRLVN
jgi:hypothetical protein